MALSYICMHYFVSFTDFERENNQETSLQQTEKKFNPNLPVGAFMLNNNFNSKKLLNFKRNNESVLLKKLKSNVIKVYSSPRRNYSVSVTNYFLRTYNREKDENQIKFHRPPSIHSAYNLKNKTSEYFSQILQDRILLHLLNTTALNQLNSSSDGFFIEAGAYDGETWSNTLYLEKSKNWTGLLIEPSVDNFKILKQKNRKAYLVNNCLCAGQSSINSTYIEAGPFGITANVSTSSSSTISSTSPIVVCHPLSKILDQFYENYKVFKNKKSKISNTKANDQIIIDYLSLDIEGNEKSIVKTFDWQKYHFNFVNIEYNQDTELYKWLKFYLKQYGYKETVVDDVWHQDLHMAHETVYTFLNKDLNKVSQFVELFA